MGEACVRHACCRAPTLPKVPTGRDLAMLQPCIAVDVRSGGDFAGKRRQEVGPADGEAGPDPLDLTPSQRCGCLLSKSSLLLQETTRLAW